jgi:hypothetical protein
LWYRFNDRIAPSIINNVNELSDTLRDNDRMNWVVNYKMSNSRYASDYSEAIMKVRDRLIITLYFSMTTFTTVGYGDFYPRNSLEQKISIVWQIFNALLFGIVTNFIINWFKKYHSWVSDDDRTHQLRNWFEMINRIRLGESNVGVDIP